MASFTNHSNNAKKFKQNQKKAITNIRKGGKQMNRHADTIKHYYQPTNMPGKRVPLLMMHIFYKQQNKNVKSRTIVCL